MSLEIDNLPSLEIEVDTLDKIEEARQALLKASPEDEARAYGYLAILSSRGREAAEQIILVKDLPPIK